MDETPDGYDYAEKSDLEIARHINLALLLNSGISEQDAGFDTIVGLNDAGLASVAKIIGKVRAAAVRGDDKKFMPGMDAYIEDCGQ